MSLTISTKTYSADRIQPDNVRYVGPANSVSIKDYFILGRTAPKPTSTFSGVSRFFAKNQATVEVNSATGETAVASGNLELSLPVGMTDTAIDSLLADMASFLGSTAGKDAVKKALINL